MGWFRKQTPLTNAPWEDDSGDPTPDVEQFGVDWSALSTAYGAATSVPRYLDALNRDDEGVRDEAVTDLWCLCHQETVYDASSVAVPMLLRAARQAPLNAAQRNQILALLVCIGRGEDTCWQGYTSWEVVVSCSDAVARVLPEIVQWAREGGAEAARWSVALAAYFPEVFRETGADVRTLLPDPASPAVELAQSIVNGSVPSSEAIRAAAAHDEDTLDWLDTGMDGMSDARKARNVVLDFVEKQPVT